MLPGLHKLGWAPAHTPDTKGVKKLQDNMWLIHPEIELPVAYYEYEGATVTQYDTIVSDVAFVTAFSYTSLNMDTVRSYQNHGKRPVNYIMHFHDSNNQQGLRVTAMFYYMGEELQPKDLELELSIHETGNRPMNKSDERYKTCQTKLLRIAKELMDAGAGE